MTWTNGDVYDGDWVDNKKHGKGKMTYPNGDLLESYTRPRNSKA